MKLGRTRQVAHPLAGPAQHLQRLAIAALRQIDAAKGADDRQLCRIPAPAPFELLELRRGRVGRHQPLGQRYLDDPELGGRSDAVQWRAGNGRVDRQRPVALAVQFEQPRLHQPRGQLVRRRGVLAEAVGQQGSRCRQIAQLQRRQRMGRAEAGLPVVGELIDDRGARRKRLTRAGPVAVLDRDIALPDLGRGIAGESPGGEVGLGFIEPTDRSPGCTAQAPDLGFSLQARRLGDHGVQDADALEPQPRRDQKAGEGQSRFDGGAGIFGRLDGFLLGAILKLAIAPREPFGTGVRPLREDHRRIGGLARQVRRIGCDVEGLRRRRHRQSARTRHGDQIALRCDGQVVGLGLDRETLRCRQQGDVDGLATIPKALAGREGGDGGEPVADHRIGQPDGFGRPGHPGDELCLATVVPIDFHGLRRAGRRAADGHAPGRALPCRRNRQALRCRNADGGVVRPLGPARFPSRAELGALGQTHAGGGVEHDPDRIAATEHGGPDGRRPLEVHHHLLGVGSRGDRYDPVGRYCVRRCRNRRCARGVEVQPHRAVGDA